MATDEQELHLAVRESNGHQVAALLDKGTDINCMFYGWTPLQLAINQACEDLTLLLIERGCDINLHDGNHVPPFEDAVRRKLSKTVAAMLENGAEPNMLLTDGDTALCRAVEKNCIELANVLIKGKADIRLPNAKGHLPLYIASKEGQVTMTQLLLQSGADSKQVCKEEDGQMPLIAATTNDHLDVVRELIKDGCDVNTEDCDGWTALWHAYSNSNHDIMKLLLKSGADKNVKNEEGKTILDDAEENEDEDVIELFTKIIHAWT